MIYLLPGTFDPPTLGHLDMIIRAKELVETLLVGVAHNPAKKPLFTVEERIEMLRALAPKVEVVAIDGLLVDFAKKRGVTAFIRGMRNLSDYEKEGQRAFANLKIGGIETLFIHTNPLYAHISSSLLREVAQNHHTITDFVPSSIADKVLARLT